MANTLHRNFKQAADAENARNALLAAGFQSSAVKLNLHEVDPDKVDITTAAVDNIMKELTPGPDVDAASIPHPAALLTVDADTDEERSRAESIMQSYGATEA
jgi:hypothetical protein